MKKTHALILVNIVDLGEGNVPLQLSHAKKNCDHGSHTISSCKEIGASCD